MKGEIIKSTSLEMDLIMYAAMNIDQLKGVIAIEEEGSVSRAAKRLFISQSSLSNSIAVLEREVGFPIFDRSNLGMRVTPQGRKLISYARSILSFADDIMSINGSENKTCRFRLVARHSLDLQKAFSAFCLAHKDDAVLEISYVPATPEHTVEMVHRNLADVGFIRIEQKELDKYEKYCASRGILLRAHINTTVEVIFAKNHPLSRAEDLIAALPSHPLVTSPNYSDHMFLAEAEQILDTHSLDRIGNRKIIVENWDAMLELVAQGVGYRFGFLPKELMERFGLQSKPLDMHFVCCSVVSEDKKYDPHVMEFEKILTEIFDNMGK